MSAALRFTPTTACWVALAAGLQLIAPQYARGYIDRAPTLGSLIVDAQTIVVLEVEKVDRESRVILYRVADVLANRTMADVAGQIRHKIGDGLNPREPQEILAWARPNKIAVCFLAGNTAVTYFDKNWYECSAASPNAWVMTRGRAELTLAYCGSAELLRAQVAEILAGKEVTISAVRKGVRGSGDRAVAYKQAIHGPDSQLWFIRASLKMPPTVSDVVGSSQWVVGESAGAAGAIAELLGDLKSAEAPRRAAAAEMLGLVGRPAKSALPALLEAMHDADEWVRVAAAAAVVRINPRHAGGIAELQKMMRSDDAGIRRAAVVAIGNLGSRASASVDQLIAAIDDPDPAVQWAAVESTGQCPNAAETAVPALRKALGNRELLPIAIEALGMIGPRANSAVAELTVSLSDANESIRWAAALALLRVDSRAAQGAIPLFLTALRSSNPRTRWDAIWYLEQLPEPESALEGLMLLAKDESPDIRVSSLEALGNIGPNARSAMPTVVQALADGVPAVCIQAAQALSLIGTEDSETARRAAKILVELLSQSDPPQPDWVRWDAAWYMRKLGPIESIALPEFCQLATHPKRDVRLAALEAISGTGEDAKGAIPILAKLLSDTDSAVQLGAAEAWYALGADVEQVLPTLVSLLDAEEGKVRAGAATLLKQMGPAARTAIGNLASRLNDSDMTVRLAAAEALWMVERQADRVLPLYRASLDDADPAVRIRAALDLGEMGPPASPCVAELRKALNDQDVHVRVAAAASLQTIQPASLAAVAVLVADLNDPDVSVRQQIIDILGHCGMGAKSALPPLREFLEEDQPEARFSAAAAILQIQPDDRDALAAVVAFLEDEGSSMRMQAVELLGELGSAAKPAVPALEGLSGGQDRDLAALAKEVLAKLAPLDSNAGSPSVDWLFGIMAVGLVLTAAVAIHFVNRCRPRLKAESQKP